MSDYHDFLRTKAPVVPDYGFEVDPASFHPLLFEFQRDFTTWALRKGRSAIFADTGLGKTFMQLEWAKAVSEYCNAPVLIVAPLSVAKQTVDEGRKIDIDAHYTRTPDSLAQINTTNYEMVKHFDPALFAGVVLDESSILKSFNGKTRQTLTEMFENTLYKLCCTATPAPNDVGELSNHSEFLGIMTGMEMLATFFTKGSTHEWRLKGHAAQQFYRWLASWGMAIRKPSDLGYEDNFELPSLNVIPNIFDAEYVPEGQLFSTGLKGLSDRLAVRREMMGMRIEQAASIVNGSGEQWLVWCWLNKESDALARAFPHATVVQGSDSIDYKEAVLRDFQHGEIEILITKPKIAGFGMNFQNCRNMLFFGLTDSWETYYQATRRCWRYGQERPVNVHIALAEPERPIFENILRKEREADRMMSELIENAAQYERAELLALDTPDFEYAEEDEAGDNWTMMLGDSAERMGGLADDSIDLSVFSPPFISLYTYTATERDLGNSRGKEEFFGHFDFIIREILRTTKPGRLCCVHVAQVAAMKVRDGYIGMKDFRGWTIEGFEDRGWIYQGEVCIDKDPQAQAIRTHSKGLLFAQLKRDASWLRPAIADYILVFRKPGENAVPIHPDVTNNEWIEFARPVWYNVRESETLQYRQARADDDERHIAPLQLEVIRRCVRLWSNEGETVLSPFAGIGSEGYVSLLLGRKFVGIELKPEYYRMAVRNLTEAAQQAVTPDLFDWAGIDLDAMAEDMGDMV
jgi:DNA modification methylase